MASVEEVQLEVLGEEGNKQLNDLQQRNLNITKINLTWRNIQYVPKLRPLEEKEYSERQSWPRQRPRVQNKRKTLENKLLSEETNK